MWSHATSGPARVRPAKESGGLTVRGGGARMGQGAMRAGLGSLSGWRRHLGFHDSRALRHQTREAEAALVQQVPAAASAHHAEENGAGWWRLSGGQDVSKDEGFFLGSTMGSGTRGQVRRCLHGRRHSSQLCGAGTRNRPGVPISRRAHGVAGAISRGAHWMPPIVVMARLPGPRWRRHLTWLEAIGGGRHGKLGTEGRALLLRLLLRWSISASWAQGWPRTSTWRPR